MRSFFTVPENVSADEITLFEDASHIKNVLRMKAGDEALCLDGSGAEYRCEILEVAKDFVRLKILEKTFSKAEPEIKVTVFQGLAKADKMEQIVQKCTELGAVKIVPVKMERSVVKLDKNSDKPKRWNKISREAAKQCKRGIVPEVSDVLDFKEAVGLMKDFDLKIMPYEELGHEGEKGLKTLLSKFKNAKNIAVIIGSEGGFSDGEAEFAIKSGINCVGLGKRILRTETAASTVLAALMYEYNEF